MNGCGCDICAENGQGEKNAPEFVLSILAPQDTRNVPLITLQRHSAQMHWHPETEQKAVLTTTEVQRG